MKKYNPKQIESRWQTRWAKSGIYKTPQKISDEKKCYVLDMFPYPSGEGLHVGHPKGYIAADIYSRFKRMNGFSVLHPMGWDAFGLPAENFALKHKMHPRVAVSKNIRRFKEQLSRLGFDYDWGREINTTDPAYYRWTQWIFLKLFENGLAYESDEPINWCPSCKTGLANEDVEDGKCERCGSLVEKKKLRQWVLKIREYADRLLADLEGLEWPESIKESQRNWIGKSEGAEIDFELFTPMRFVLLHGYRGSPDRNFFPWLIKELETRGHSVIAPELPNSHNPTIMEQVEFVLDSVAFDKNTVLLGHSLGSVVALKVLERLETPIQKLIIAGGFLEPRFKDHPRSFEATFNWKFNFKKIQKNVRHVVVLHDNNDSVIPQKQALLLSEKLGGICVEFDAKEDHITAKEEPAVLRQCVEYVSVFTTRPDTLFGATYLVLAPEHKMIADCKSHIANWDEVERYAKKAKNKSDLDRTAAKEKIGVELKGISATNPANGEKIPVWVADYVLLEYGTGAIMAVPAHDERDFSFALRYHLPVQHVVAPRNNAEQTQNNAEVFTDEGIMINSGVFNGLSNKEAREKIIEFVCGRKRVTYKLRDWVFSRQRYWGEPIPLVFCEHCAERIKNQEPRIKNEFNRGELLNPGWIAVSEKDLPVKLPEVKKYEPTGTGESPLANIKTWVRVKCPKCGGGARRETNTMPQWAGSSWYYLAYIMRGISNFQFPISKYKTAFKHWLPVDMYVGGTEHATRHLVYARFWHKFLYDIGVVSVKEPFAHLKNQGLILGEDGRKMSKRWGNVINPDDVVERFGADSLRVYEMFMGPFGDSIAWSTDGVVGARRFLERVFYLRTRVSSSKNISDKKEIESLVERTIKKVTDDIVHFKFNTAVSALMILTNALEKEETISRKTYETLLLLLSPFAPHITEELWNSIGRTGSIHRAPWPSYDEKKMQEEFVRIAVQVNGKVRDELLVRFDEGEEEVKKKAVGLDRVKKWVQSGNILKVIYIEKRLVNVVTD